MVKVDNRKRKGCTEKASTKKKVGRSETPGLKMSPTPALRHAHSDF